MCFGGTDLAAGDEGGGLLYEELRVDGVVVLQVQHCYLDVLAQLVLVVQHAHACNESSSVVVPIVRSHRHVRSCVAPDRIGWDGCDPCFSY